jgi:hypothetical protein
MKSAAIVKVSGQMAISAAPLRPSDSPRDVTVYSSYHAFVNSKIVHCMSASIEKKNAVTAWCVTGCLAAMWALYRLGLSLVGCSVGSAQRTANGRTHRETIS